MERAVQSPAEPLSRGGSAESSLFSIESVLKLQKLIFAGSPLCEVLTNIAQLVESQAEGMSCTIWLPDEDGKELHCAAAPSLPGFNVEVGTMAVGPHGGSCGTAIHRRESVYVTDILTDPLWDNYRDRMVPYGIRSVWSRPLFTSAGKALGTFSLNYREPRFPGAKDLLLIENASHITGIAIERHQNEEELRRERDRLRLLLEITSSATSRLDLRQVVEALSTSLFRVMQCDVSALLLPDFESGVFRVTILHNPDARGPFREGSFVPMNSSIAGKVLRTGKTIRIDTFEQVRDDPEIYGNPDGQLLYARVAEENLRTGCYLPLVSRDRVVGVLMLARRSDNIFAKDDVVLLERVASQVAIAVENTLDYETAIKDRDKETTQRRYFEEEIRAGFGEIVGESPELKTTLSLVSVVAPTDSSVLIFGETGTGKELVARAIHKASNRGEKAFVKLNCAAIPLGLLESELFGHEKGAFTGAIARKIGRLELAHEGTLFLDEVGELPLDLQPKILRALQEREIERLGGTRPIPVNVRLIAATNRDLAKMVAEKQFRSDLFYRLKVFPVFAPPLRERAADIPTLVRHFVSLHSRRMGKTIETIPPAAMEALTAWKWPGNIRELENFLERAVILSRGPVLHVPVAELEDPDAEEDDEVSTNPTLVAAEREHILRALREAKGMIGGPAGAAARLGLKRTTLNSKIKKLGIARGDYMSS
jgi:formate hydrogenlyase transcriptional activator